MTIEKTKYGFLDIEKKDSLASILILAMVQTIKIMTVIPLVITAKIVYKIHKKKNYD